MTPPPLVNPINRLNPINETNGRYSIGSAALARQSVPELIETGDKGGTFKGGSLNDCDRAILDKQRQRVSATTLIEPRLGFQTGIQDRKPRYRQAYLQLWARFPDLAKFSKQVHHRPPNRYRPSETLCERDAKQGGFF
jgi:hypothetical protein